MQLAVIQSPYTTMIERLFTELNADRVDEFGFLDRGRTPRLLRFDRLLCEPLAWILGPPWLGKSTVASAIDNSLGLNSHSPSGCAHRHTLTKLGTSGADRDVPPEWWREWSNDNRPDPAVWLIDGVDEGLDRNQELFCRILAVIDDASPDHLRQLRLLLFSRPHAELGDFRAALQRRYADIGLRAESLHFWLARLDRTAATAIVGPERFPAVLELIRRCSLQPVAGYPVVLRYLKGYPEIDGLNVPLVRRGILTALLGDRHTNSRDRFDTTAVERFDAACRIAAVLTLTQRDSMRAHSPDPGVPTLGTLFQNPANRVLAAARETVQTAAFQHLPDLGSFCFTQRNVQDWFTAFALERLPLPTLRSALTGPGGTLLPRFHEVARLIWAATDGPDVRAEMDRLSGGIMLPSDAVEPTLAKSIQLLDRLEALASETPWGLRLGADSQDDLCRLRVDGLGAVLAERLQCPNRTHQVKRMLIDVAEATKALDAVEPAMELVCDVTANASLRAQAMWFVCRFGGPDHLWQLEGSIGEGAADAEIDREIRGVLIAELLKRDMWTLSRAALHVPPRDPNVVDARFVVLQRLTESLTIDEARLLLPHLRALTRRHADEHHPHCFPDFISRAVDLLTDQQPTSLTDLDALVRFAVELIHEDFGWPMARELAFRLRVHPTARRSFFEHDMEAIRSGRDEPRIGAQSFMLPDDWRWLRDQALGRWASCRVALECAYWMARKAHDEGSLPTDDWHQFVESVEQHIPSLPAQVEAGIRNREQERSRIEAERHQRERRGMQQVSIVERIRQILGQPDLSAANRMRRLGYLCATHWWSVGIRGAAAEEELPELLWRQVLDVFLRGLNASEPIQNPNAEGTAFSHVACSPEHAPRLTEPTIRRWLPIALHAHTSMDWTTVIRACWTVSQPATEEALGKAIGDEVRRAEHHVLLETIPSECWTDSMTQQVIALIGDEAIRPRARRELLERLAAFRPEEADETAAGWAARPVVAGDEDQLRQAGCNVLLVRNPLAALHWIERDFRDRGSAVLEELTALWSRHNGMRVRWQEWPLDLLERLGRLLLEGFPVANEPVFEGGFVTPDYELRDLRRQLLDYLFSRPEPATQAALDRLASMDTAVRGWLATSQASAQAGQLLPTTSLAAGHNPTALSVEAAVRLLDRSGYRLIRSADDLLDVTLDALRKIESEVGHDLPLLYHPPDRTEGGGRPRKHLEEDALQVYLRRRLLDLLPRIADNVDVQILREDQIGRRQRLDLRVIAPRHGTGQLAVVVVEVKWSTNRETGTGLTSQLGKRYLLGEGRTHGIYLVGWCGEWLPGDGTGANTDKAALERFLTEQRNGLCEPGHPGAGLRIEPFLLDVRWRQTGA